MAKGLSSIIGKQRGFAGVDQALQSKCEHCQYELPSHWLSQHVCPHCLSPQEVPIKDYFQAFGLEPKFHLHLEELRARFYEISRFLHPDRLRSFPEKMQSYALSKMSLVNQAYDVLREPHRRREYLLQRAQIKSQEAKLPLALAEAWFELQENHQPEKIQAFEQELELERTRLQEKLQKLESEFDLCQREEILSDMSYWVHQSHYLDSLKKDLNRVKKHAY